MVEKRKYLKMVLTTGYVLVIGLLSLLAIDYLESFKVSKSDVLPGPELKAPPKDILFSQSYTDQNGNEAVKYAYMTEAVPPDEGEDITLRTPNSKTYPIRTYQDENGEYKKEVTTSFFSGLPQMYEDGGEWRQVEYATTTPEMLVASGASYQIKKRHFIDLLLPGKEAFAQSGTYYPDPHTESTTVDGNVYYIYGDWATARGATNGYGFTDDAVTMSASAGIFEFYGAQANISRAFILFNTAALPDTANVTAATLDVYVTAKSNTDNDGDDTINVVTSTPASNTTLATDDFEQIGTTIQAPALDITSVTTSADNTFTFNATGRGNIALTGVTKLALREGHDLINSSPVYTSDNGVTVSTAEATGTTNDPTLNVTYTTDTTPPTPNPMTYSTAPYGASTASVSMTASLGSDAGGSTPVEYQFDYNASCPADNGTGGTDSAFQTNRTYTDSGLQVNKCYAYRVRARDSLANTGTYSGYSTAYTLANTPGAVAVSSITGTSAIINNDENGNPAASPATTFAVYISATSPTDSTWNTRFVDASGNPSVAAVWLTDAQLTNLTLNSLTPSTQYTIASKARNGDNDETVYGATNNFTTSFAESSTEVRLLDGIRLKDGIRLY